MYEKFFSDSFQGMALFAIAVGFCMLCAFISLAWLAMCLGAVLP